MKYETHVWDPVCFPWWEINDTVSKIIAMEYLNLFLIFN